MDNKEINLLFNLTILIHEDKWFEDNKSKGWFSNNKPRRSREEVQEWVAKQLAKNLQIYTIPCGMSWGVLTDKEQFDEYWKENSKIDV